MRIRGIDGQSLTPSETVEMKYVIYWNDGRALSQVNAFVQQLQSGALNARFRTE